MVARWSVAPRMADLMTAGAMVVGVAVFAIGWHRANASRLSGTAA